MRITPVCMMLLVLTGCQSTPPTKYFTLNMDSTGQAKTPAGLIVDRVEVGEALSRRDIMIKESPTEIEYYATSQWAAGLDEMIRQKLQEEFGSPADGRASLQATVTVLAFEQIDVPGGADARAKLAVEVRTDTTSRHDAPLLVRQYESRKKAATERPADVVQALSELLEAIALQMAADVAALQKG